MSVITKIRDRAGLMVVIIGLAIASFLLMDVFSSNSMFAGSSANAVGEIDGEEIGIQFFETRVADAIENYKVNTNQDRLDEATISMLRDQVWNELVREKIMGNAYARLGLSVSGEELYDMVQGTNINASVRQAFSNPQTGEFDRNQVIQFLRNLDEQPEDIQRRWFNFEKYIRSDRESQKYNNLISKGLYVPAFFARKQYNGTARQANGRFVLLDYALIADSTVTVSDKELKAWYNNNLKDFESKEEIRGIDYLVFDIKASEDDELRAMRKVSELREQFLATTNDSMFVSLNSDLPFDENYVAEAALSSEVQRMMFNSGELNAVSEVYREGDYFKMTKMIARSSRPDSVKARHILIRQKEGEEEEAARNRADSLLQLAKRGNFDALARANSEDPGSAEKGGDLGFFAEGMMVKPFNDACFEGKKGDMVLVKSDFGWHIINITDQKGRREVAKFATIANMIEPTTETYRDVYARASKFLSKVKNAEDFEREIEEQGLVKRSAESIRIADRSIGALPNSREMVRWAFRSKSGDLSSVFELEDKYVVAALVKVSAKGTKPFEEVRAEVEAKVKRDKKAAQLKERFQAAGDQTDIEAIAKAVEGVVQNISNASFQGNFLAGVGREPRLTGVMFSLEAGKLSKPVQGERGVYVVLVDNFTEPDANADITGTKESMRNQLGARAGEAFNAKKELVKQEDNRHMFY
jgi:peptidyl-prolyl cis-trans isomerase D